MKKLLIFVITAAILLGRFAILCHAENHPSLSAHSAILIDFDSGQVLYEKNAHQRLGMASTTKIITALTVLSLASPEETVTVTAEAVGIEGSSVYLSLGERLTVEQLLYALLLASANDAAVALAVHCSGSVDKFADQMNKIAAELGLEDTHLTNPHGLYDENHYTTAYELSIICREAMKNDLLSKIFATYKATIPFCGEPDKRLVVNHNKLLKRYDGAIGVKTGFTKKTGRCLVSAARREGLTLICVTLNAPDDWRDHTSLLDYGFKNYRRCVIAEAGEYSVDMPTVGGETDSVTLTNSSPLVLTLPIGVTNAEYLVEAHQRFLYAPVCEGESVATLTVSHGEQAAVSPLVVTEGVEKAEQKGFWKKLLSIKKP